MLGTLLLLVTGFCLLLFLFRTRRPKNFPPGPPIIPVLGNLLQLSLANPLKDLETLSKRYGKVFSLYLGDRPAVILTGLEAVKEAMVTRAVDFAGRPQGLLVSHVTQSKGVIMANYGPIWRDHRRFALMMLRNFGLGKQSMEERILDEISHVVACLEKSAGKSMCPQHLFHNAASDIICSIMFGSRYEYEDERFQAIIKMMVEATKIANGPWAMIYDTLPILRNLPLPFKKAFQIFYKVREHIREILAEHKKSRVLGEPRDLADCYLDEWEKRGIDSSFDEVQTVAVLTDLLFAGTDTTSNTLLTGFLYLMTHPEIQEKCQQEIDAVLGGKAQVSFEDRHAMPYVQAVVHETQRIADTVPLSLFHATTKETKLMGYDIPQGTLIIQNLSSVLHDESHWKFPYDFNPSNFLNEQGEFVKPEGFMPFSAGPRVCLGEGLARMELFLVLVTLLRRFQFMWPEDGGVPDYTPVFGVTQAPRPYRLGIKLRGEK